MKKFPGKFTALALCATLLPALAASGQKLPDAPASHVTAAAPPQNPNTPLPVSLQDAIRRAEKLSPTLAGALANAQLAAGAATQARAANLPNVSAITQYLYTEGDGFGKYTARFIANNGVHEYVAQADVHQAISGPLLFESRRAALLKAVAADQATIAQRGLIVTVVQAYANLYGALGKLSTALQTLAAARNFLTITQERQKNGDAAYSDVLKASIQADDTESAVENARLVLEQSRVALALLIFRNVNRQFRLTDDPSQVLSLPPRDRARTLARTANPALDAAEKNATAAGKALTAARLGYLPSLSFDYYYGIDANEFATQGTFEGKRIHNLGYSALGSLTMPIFNWGATQSSVRDARSLKSAAQTSLDYARRQALGNFELFYSEAQVAHHDLALRQQAYNDAVHSRKLTLLQYRAGVATALEVVVAETAVDTESTALYDAKTRYATAIANLATLTGRL